MINKATIENTYKKFNKRPASPDELNLGVLFGDVFENHGLKLDEKYLTINSVDPASPFHRIPLRNICEIVEFADHVAVVLPASMIIMQKDSPDVFINIKTRPASLEERLRGMFHSPKLMAGMLRQQPTGACSQTARFHPPAAKGALFYARPPSLQNPGLI